MYEILRATRKVKNMQMRWEKEEGMGRDMKKTDCGDDGIKIFNPPKNKTYM